MSTKVTDLEFRLYEAMKTAHAMLTYKPGEATALEVADKVLRPALYGDDDVADAMKAEQHRRSANRIERRKAGELVW